jgi:hypothetical protein
VTKHSEKIPGLPNVTIFKNIFAKKLRKNVVVDSKQNKTKIWNVGYNIGFWENLQFFRQKLAKMAEISDHNIDPKVARWHIFMPKTPIRAYFDILVGPITENVDIFYWEYFTNIWYWYFMVISPPPRFGKLY